MEKKTNSTSAFKKLKSASGSGNIKSLRFLTPGSYEVKRFKTLNTKYGKRLIVCIQKAEYFLPHRFAEAIEGPETLKELNDRSYIMIYGGMDASKHNRQKVDFMEASPQESEQNIDDLGMDTVE